MVAVNYDWDELEDNIDEEYDDSGNTIAEYTTEPDLYGNVVSQRRSGQSSFLHCDGLGSTLALTNASGTVADTYAYSAFGEVTEQTGSTVNPFQYIGQKGYYQVALAATVVRRRLFTTSIGRWTSRDPLGISASHHNMYVYADNTPSRFVDPSGLIWALPCFFLIDQASRITCPLCPLCLLIWGPFYRQEDIYEKVHDRYPDLPGFVRGDFGSFYVIDGSPVNAVSHCYAACSLASNCGAPCTKLVSLCREAGTGAPGIIDRHNDEEGIKCSIVFWPTDDWCLECCKKKFDNGNLKTKGQGAQE